MSELTTLEQEIAQLEARVKVLREKNKPITVKIKKIHKDRCSICGKEDTELVRFSATDYAHSNCLPTYTPPPPTKKRIVHLVMTVPVDMDLSSKILVPLMDYKTRVLTDKVIEQ